MRYLALCLLLLFVGFPASAKEAQDFFHPFKLERVIDGDTIVASGRKIRLWGIDAPEKGDPLFKVATMFLESVLAEGGLSCKFIEKDRYKRDVMHCGVNGADIGSMMVQMGMARDYTRYSGGFYQEEEADARKNVRGIWKPGNQSKAKRK
jgi:endonuclease YncB( thermonuclease family)